MGGPGSGNWYRWDKKTTTDEVHRLDVRYMRKHGLLKPGYSGTLSWSRGGEKTGSIGYHVWSHKLVLKYRAKIGGEWEDVEEPVQFDRTSCHYGGERLWFLCPHCGRRVAVRYGHRARFLCRHCYALPYGSQNEDYVDRMVRKARRLRARLGASDDLSQPILWKPKGMHQKTFERLRKAAEKADEEAALALAAKIGMFEAILGPDFQP